MLHQALFLALYLGLLPVFFVSPFAGVLLYQWLDYLPPNEVYSLTLIPGYLALVTGALTFLLWIVKERKTLPRPFGIILCLLGLLIWINVTTHYALVPEAAVFKWDRTIKVIGFAILTAQMLSTRARLEAVAWAFVLAVTYYALPSA